MIKIKLGTIGFDFFNVNNYYTIPEDRDDGNGGCSNCFFNSNKENISCEDKPGEELYKKLAKKFGTCGGRKLNYVLKPKK